MQKTVLEQELRRTGVPIENVLSRYRIHKLEQMTPEIYTKALSGLKIGRGYAGEGHLLGGYYAD